MTIIDETKLEEFMGQVVGHMTGGALCFGMWVGDELGLYAALAEAGPLSADALASQAGCNARLVREWLDGQVAGGLVGYDPTTDDYALSPEATLALADDTSPAFVARAMNAFGSMFMDIDKITAAFRGDGGLAWGDHHPCLFSGTEWFFRTGYRAELPGWIAALDGVAAKLETGSRVADIGCGHGASVAARDRAVSRLRLPRPVDRGRCRRGAQAGETRLREVATQAGFTRFRRAAETPLNLVLELRP